VSPVRIGVIGLGLIGGSIAKRLAGRYEIRGLDDDSQQRDAIELVRSQEELVEWAELIVVAVPPQQTASVIDAVLAGNQDVLVTDVASVKAPIIERVAGDLDRYLPSHPLAGSERSGWDSARPDLLDKTTWAVCPSHSNAPVEPLCRWASVFEAFDARLIVCDPKEHDGAVARTSHAPHVVASVIAASLDGAQTKLDAALSGGAFRDMIRIAHSDPGLWSEVVQLNRDHVTAVLKQWAADLERPEWDRGQAMAELVERVRWQEPTWEERSFDWPAWDDLIELGREGIAVRRLEHAHGRLSAEVAAWQTPPSWPT
jgi:prephenate dehydrogenase